MPPLIANGPVNTKFKDIQLSSSSTREKNLITMDKELKNISSTGY